MDFFGFFEQFIVLFLAIDWLHFFDQVKEYLDIVVGTLKQSFGK